MNREEYLSQLRKYLKRLPKDDYENAMEYFTEYFDEAGEEGEQNVIEELGTPKEAAGELFSNLVTKKVNTSKREKHYTKNVMLLSILAILTAPISVPLAMSLIILAGCLIFTLVCVIASVFILGVSFGLVGMKLILRAIVAIPCSAPGTLVIGGMGLFGIGCSILIIAAGICLIRIFKNWIPHFMQKIVKRRRVKRDEKKQ